MAERLSGGLGMHRFDYGITARYWEDPVNYSKIVEANPLESPSFENVQPSDGPLTSVSNDEHQTEQSPAASTPLHQNEDRFKFITSEDIAKPPYSSIGKVFWLDASNSVDWCTAFYIGGGEIMTVAHAFFHGENSRNLTGIVFVPAMDGNGDIFGKKYGYYPVEFAMVHPRYNRGDPLLTRSVYDVATCQLGQGKKLKAEVYSTGNDYLGSLQGLTADDLESKFEETGSILFKPIAPMSFRLHPPGKPTVWTIIGYGMSSAKYEGSRGSLCKISGSKVPYYYMKPGHQSLDSNKILAMNLITLPGMSGGPWLVGSGKEMEPQANGCQALSEVTNQISLTPRFTSGLLNEFGLM